MPKERFVPIQIDQESCLKCERCLKACKVNKAIYFKNSIRLVDYSKCKGCLNCVQVCPRNAIEVTSVIPDQVLNIKVDHDKCNMCELCVDDNGNFCPQHLYYKDTIIKDGNEMAGIRFKFKEIAKCQGCLACESSCPEGAIQPVIFRD